MRSELGRLQREAAESQDRELAAAVRVEGNAYLIFETAESFEQYQETLPTLLFSDDLPYFRARARTPNLLVRARYLHAIAAISKRKDDGRAAADAYLDAIDFYHAQPTEKNGEAFAALRILFPMAGLMSRRYGVADRYKSLATAFITDARPHFAALRGRVLIAAVSDKAAFKSDDLAVLRNAALNLFGALAGNDTDLIVELGAAVSKMLGRLGDSPDVVMRAEANALEQNITLNSQPLNVEMVGSRLIHLYGRLKDVEARQRIVERMRAARAQQEFQVFGGQPEGWSEEIERLRAEAARLARDYGSFAFLSLIGGSRQFIPSVKDVQDQVERLEAEGIGMFRQLVQVVVSHGERIVGHESSPFDEQYGIYWQFLAVGRAAVMLGELLISGDVTLEHLQAFLSQSWIARDEHIPYGGGEEMPNDLVWLLRAPLRLYVGANTGEFAGDVLVPALDSLTLRIEAVLRKLARLLRRPDTDANSEGVTKYHGIKRLLKDEVLVAALGPDLVQFIAFTLIREPEGLRDKIGHAILHFGQYRVTDLDAVVLVLLRLAALDVPEISGTQEEADPPQPPPVT